MLLVRKALSKLLDHGIKLEGFLDHAGQLDQSADQATLALGVAAVVASERDDQHAQSGQLGRECLGRSDADLRTGPRQHHKIYLPYQ